MSVATSHASGKPMQKPHTRGKPMTPHTFSRRAVPFQAKIVNLRDLAPIRANRNGGADRKYCEDAPELHGVAAVLQSKMNKR